MNYYAVEWRVINAADYGMPQRRRYSFVPMDDKTYSKIKHEYDMKEWITHKGIVAKAFPVHEIKSESIKRN